VECAGMGKDTTFLGATPHVDTMVQAVADHFHISITELMDFYMDIAEGFEGITTRQRALIKAISSYNPE